ncbi:MAG TPA: cytochrome c biogenesis protein CcsA [Rhodanobacteraceae bacterium]|nr:cytochrome c biogenesis protein CcsA [Rhodanobacteraceae bacterium]
MPVHSTTMELLAVLSIALYLAAAAALARPLLDAGGAVPRRAALVTGAIAVIIHFVVLFGIHRGAVDLHFYAALSLVSAVIAALTLVVNLVRPVAALGIILFPIAGLFLAIDEFLAPVTAPFQLDWQIKLHVAIALVAYSLLAIAAVLALLLATQERALRSRQFSAWARTLPPLTQTESLMFKLIGAGFALLTLTLLSGALFVHNLHAQHQAHTAILSLVAWIIFGVLLIGRWRWGWRGPRAVNLTLLGMVILLLAFFGSKFVLEEILHRRGM